MKNSIPMQRRESTKETTSEKAEESYLYHCHSSPSLKSSNEKRSISDNHACKTEI